MKILRSFYGHRDTLLNCVDFGPDDSKNDFSSKFDVHYVDY